ASLSDAVPLPVFNPLILVGRTGRAIRQTARGPEVERWVVSVSWINLIRSGVAVAVAEWILNVLHVLRLVSRKQHVRLELHVALACGSPVPNGVAAQFRIQIKTGQAVRRAVWISGGSRIQVIRIRIARINSIVGLVIFTRVGQGSDFVFG